MLLLAMAVGIVYSVAFTARGLVEPRGRTLRAFAREHDEPHRLAKVRVRERTYIVWFGSPRTTLLRLGSGPPCYVFDMGGTLVGWSAVTNDGHCEPLASEAWSARSEPLTLANALQLVDAGQH